MSEESPVNRDTDISAVHEQHESVDAVSRLGDHSEIRARVRPERVILASLLIIGFAYLLNASSRAVLEAIGRYGMWILPLGAVLLFGIWALSGLRWSASRVIVGTVSAYLLWAFISGSEPVSDFVSYAKLAEAFSSSRSLELLYEAKTPGSIVWYSLFVSLLGSGTAALKVGAAVAWSIGNGAFFSVFSRLTASPRAAALGVLMFGLAPGLVAYSAVVSSEAVFMMWLAVALMLALKSQDVSGSASLALATLSSLSFGLAYLAVPTSVFFFVPVAVFLVLVNWRSHRGFKTVVAVCVALALPFGLLVLSQVGLNYAYASSLSPSPNPYAAMGLLTGTNVATGGSWNMEDMLLAGYRGDNRVPRDEANRRALEIALRRIRQDPAAVTVMWLTTKQGHLWGGERGMLAWSLQASEQVEQLWESGVYARLRRMVDGYFAIVMALAVPASVIVWRRKLLDQAIVPVIVGLSSVALTLIVLTVQHRYHIVFMPWIALIVAASWVSIFESWQEKNESTAACPTE